MQTTSSRSGWIELLTARDFEHLWMKLFDVVSKHPSIRNLHAPGRTSHSHMKDVYCDLTQDIFLKLLEKDRWQFYLDSNYTDEDVAHEIARFEIPNLVGALLRQRYPESFRMARRISSLLQTSSVYLQFPHPVYDSAADWRNKRPYAFGKRVYGLSSWPISKPMKDENLLHELIRGVPFRKRDTRRAGRGSTSQVIISNEELGHLITDIFRVIDSPAEVRTIRSLALSKLSVEDSTFISIDTDISNTQDPEAVSSRMQLADTRPTPEDALLGKELAWQVEVMVADFLENLRETANCKLRGYSRMLNVVWHCYFDALSPSQKSVAEKLRVSDALVSHYRKNFDTSLKGIDLPANEWVLFSNALRKQLAAAISARGKSNDSKAHRRKRLARIKGPATDCLAVSS